MRINNHLRILKLIILIISLFSSFAFMAQESTVLSKTKSNFWNNVQYGGGVGLNISSGYTDVFVAPSAIYNFNPFLALGAGLNMNYVASTNYFSSFVYGLSTLVLINPISEIQFSVGLDQSRVNYEEKNINTISENYWNTSLIIGAGYRSGNVTIGFGYNVLRNTRYNTEPLVPFVRAYF